jgi:hypothetical protein
VLISGALAAEACDGGAASAEGLADGADGGDGGWDEDDWAWADNRPTPAHASSVPMTTAPGSRK